MKRSVLREQIFRLLFRVEFNSASDMPEQAKLFFSSSEEEVAPESKSYIEEKYAKIVENMPAIDALINASTTGWNTERMNKVDLTILRLAVYEIKWDDDIPAKVAMNEAVELAKKYSGDSGYSFVNGVLANVVG